MSYYYYSTLEEWYTYYVISLLDFLLHISILNSYYILHYFIFFVSFLLLTAYIYNIHIHNIIKRTLSTLIYIINADT